MKASKKKKPGKYLKFYIEHMMTGYSAFLCHSFGDDDSLLQLMTPSPEETKEHSKDTGYEHCVWDGTPIRNSAWATPSGNDGRFNEFRQTIVLFMAAMNGEL